MMKFIFQNWFKLVIALVAIIISASVFYYFVILSQQKETRIQEKARLDLLEKNEKEAEVAVKEADAKKAAAILKANDTKSDTYIVTYNTDGNPIDWATLDRVAVILNDSLNTYKSAHPEIEKKQEGTRDSINLGYSTLAGISNAAYKEQLQILIKYQEAYFESGVEVLTLLRGLAQNLQGLLNAIEKRDTKLYFYYKEKTARLEAQKKSVLEDYMNKSNIMTNYIKNTPPI